MLAPGPQSEHPSLKATRKRRGCYGDKVPEIPLGGAVKDGESQPLTSTVIEEPKQKHRPDHGGDPPRTRPPQPPGLEVGSWVFSCLPSHQEEKRPHANHFLLSLPRSPDVPGWGFLKEADAGPHPVWGQHREETLSDGVTAFP